MIEWNGRELVTPLPVNCVRDCSRSGDVTASVDYWVDLLGFTVNREHAVEYLDAFGTWDDLAIVSDLTLARRVLWNFACDEKDTGETFHYLGI